MRAGQRVGNDCAIPEEVSSSGEHEGPVFCEPGLFEFKKIMAQMSVIFCKQSLRKKNRAPIRSQHRR
jgi:hypothetical protein